MVDSGIISEIKRFATHDGPGIRTTVFIKGCPLSCKWCSNPESLELQPQLYFIPKRCKNYGACITVCPEKIIIQDGKNKLIREKCTNCMKCAEECIYGAFQQVGKSYTVDEIINEIKKDIAFYGNDGGLTLSGGEPLFQPEFTISILKKCKEAGISTVLDTSGFTESGIIEEVIKHTDLVLYDVKHMDPVKHLEETGANNKIILENAIRISGKTQIRISLPLIPGFNDDEKNLEETARFAKQINVLYIDINPFHSLGKDKYMYLGLTDPYNHYRQLKKEDIIKSKRIIEKFGIKTTVGRMM
jgi:pyruvate formate lyase activating enzyme